MKKRLLNQKSFANRMKGMQLPLEEYKKQEQKEWIITEKNRVHQLEIDSLSAGSDRHFQFNIFPSKPVESSFSSWRFEWGFKTISHKSHSRLSTFILCSDAERDVSSFHAIDIGSGKQKTPEKQKEGCGEEEALKGAFELSLPKSGEKGRDKFDLSTETP